MCAGRFYASEWQLQGLVSKLRRKFSRQVVGRIPRSQVNDLSGPLGVTASILNRF
jgi:hypothetical protein